MKQTKKILKAGLGLFIVAIAGAVTKGLLRGSLLGYFSQIRHFGVGYPFFIEFIIGMTLLPFFYLFFWILSKIVFLQRANLLIQCIVMGLFAVLLFSTFSGFVVGFGVVRTSLTQHTLAMLPIFVLGAGVPVVHFWAFGRERKTKHA